MNEATEILIILALILFNGVLAMSEIAVVTARKVRLQQLVEKGNTRAAVAIELADTPGRFLSTVQIGITTIGILAGVFGGVTIAASLESRFGELTIVAAYAKPISMGIVVVTVTYLTVILGELVPKKIALSNPERIAALVAPTMRLFSRLGSPLVSLMDASARLVLRILGVSVRQEPGVTEEEIRMLIDLGTETGEIQKIEDEIVDQVFELGDMRAVSLATPRPDIIWLDQQDSTEAIRDKVTSSQFSKFPVCNGSLDEVKGSVRAKDLLNNCLHGVPVDLAAIMHTPLFVPETTPVFRVLERFKEHHSHIALVLDEYGGVEGLITMGDIMEAIIGDVPEVKQSESLEIIERQDGSHLVDGMLNIERFREFFKFNALPDDERNYYQTVGGFVVTRLGHIPIAGESFEWEGKHIEVVDMDGNRVDKVLVMQGK
ncbi:MAG: HlyC/CorC family transporter [Anaerolineales bacterium]|nr:HlyC/CorC family transporter [Anaerolineales bacterium]